MALKFCNWLCGAILFALIAIFATFVLNEKLLVPKYGPSFYPKPTRTYWGKDSDTKHGPNAEIHSFVPVFDSEKEQIMKEFIHLWLKTEETNPFAHERFESETYNKQGRLNGIGYGINYFDFKALVRYYNSSFAWMEYKSVIQSFNHSMVNIGGINIHFIKQSLNANMQSNGNTEAILLLHGWPSSFWEFHRLLKLFRTQYKSQRLDIIIASLPGYGFSEYPMHLSGFTTYSVARILRTLMETHLKYTKYVCVGGDWGAIVTHQMAFDSLLSTDKSAKLKGILVTMAMATPPLHEMLLLALNSDAIFKYYFCRKYNVSLERVKKLYSPMHRQVFHKLWDMSAYQHIHATRANTIGIALQSSPVSHLGWIYEKYLHWTHSFESEVFESGTRVIGGQLNWADILVTNNLFYLNGKVSSGIRYYTESIWDAYKYMPIIRMPKEMSVGIVHYLNDAFDFGFFERWNYDNIVMNRNHNNGGHFPALEYPQTYYDDIVHFLEIINSEG